MGLTGTAPLTVAVSSGRSAKLDGVVGALRQIYPTLPVQIEHRDGSVLRIDPRIPSRFACSRAPIVVRSWPTELQDRGVGVDAEPVGYGETERCAILQLDSMKREHQGATANGLLAIESGRLPRQAEPDQPLKGLDPVREVRADVAVVAIEGMDGRRKVFYSEATWIPIIVNGRGEATDPVVAALMKRQERERARESGEPWTVEDEVQIESGWHVREALGVDRDRSGQSWQSYVGERTPREEMIAPAIVRNRDATLVDPRRAVGRAVDEKQDPRGLDEMEL